MRPSLRSAPDELAALVGVASEALSLSAELVEKDFWVTEVLRVLQRPLASVRVIFKGGTSLSKGFGLIQRMSEDVDILLYSETALSNRERMTALEQITDGVAAYLGIAPSEERRENGRKLISRFAYSGRAMAIASSGVLLELGFRGHPEPSVEREMTSYVAQYLSDASISADFVERDSVTLSLLTPERTLMEKIFALHVAATSPPNTEDLRRMARYYYDIKMLLDHEETRAALGAFGDMEQFSENELRSAGIGQPFAGAARPAGGYACSPAFALPADMRDTIADAYDAAMRFVFTGTPQPSLDDCLQCVADHASFL